jgi:two-component system, NtrC family, sensor kinase
MYQKKDEIYLSTLDALPVSVHILDHNLKVLWANRGGLEKAGSQDLESLCSRTCYEAFFEKDGPCEGCPALRTIESGATKSAEMRLHHGSAHVSYLVTTTPLHPGGAKAPPVIVEMMQDFTSHMKADEELRRLNEFNKEIIENAPVAIFTVNQEGEFSSVNPALAVLSGLGEKAKEKLLGFNWLKNPYTIKCGLAQHIKEGLEGKPFQLWDFPFINYWGEPQYIYFKGVPVSGKDGNVEGLLCIIEETTEIVRTRAQLIQEAKMSFVGRLAAGIAHELNNPLATITANSELAKELIEHVDKDPLGSSDLNELREYIDTIEEQAYRCTRTIKNLLEVTRKKDFGANSINFKKFIEELLNGISFRKMKVKLIREIPEDIPDINGDPEALRQVFQNVISNAVDAVEGTENAAVWIRTIAKSDSMVEVAVEDNGTGIPGEMVDLIFEPFFTTKEPKKGTGLGLTLCYDFLQRMGGSIEVQQRPGGGSIFKIALPVHGGRR